MKKPLVFLKQAQQLRRQGKWSEAEGLLKKALALKSNDVDTLCQLALLKVDVGAFSEGYFYATSALETDPRSVRARALLGRIQLENGSAETALLAYDEALLISPEDPECLFGRGNALQRLGRPEEALESYSRALQLYPDKAELWCGHGNVLYALRRYDAALQSFEQGLRCRPDVALLHFNRANTLDALGRSKEALAAYDQALELEPGNADIRNNRANTRLEAGDIKGAGEDFCRVMADAPEDARGYNGFGMVLQDQGMLQEAIVHYERAVRLASGFADARHNLALARLYRGDFDQAWQEYEHRCDPAGYRAHLRKQISSVELFEGLPRWGGPADKVEGSVGIWAEQGIGDQILFSTLIPELAGSGQSFVYEVDRRLLPAYTRAFPDLRFVPLSDPPSKELTAAAAAVFCGSLPGFFRPSVESFARQPRRILQADPERVVAYRQRIGDGFRLALSWRSARVGRLGQSKSVSLADFAPFLEVPGVRGVDVQYGDVTGQREQFARDVGTPPLRFDEVDYYNDLDEVLAILEACDLLITTSNANAHLAAALGKPVWLLYPGEKAPFHYWAHGGDHRCLWYPSVEIVTGREWTDWPQLIAHAAEKLRVKVAGN